MVRFLINEKKTKCPDVTSFNCMECEFEVDFFEINNTPEDSTFTSECWPFFKCKSGHMLPTF